MAYKIKDIYPSQVSTGDTGWPDGKPRNIQGGVQGTGTPFEEKLFQDYEGSRQALFDEAGIEPSGQADRVGQSDFVDALKEIQSNKSRQAIEATYKAQGYNNVFFFGDGFTYTEPNDVGIYEDGTAWTYADAGALPVAVAPNTDPSASGDFKQISNSNVGIPAENIDWSIYNTTSREVAFSAESSGAQVPTISDNGLPKFMTRKAQYVIKNGETVGSRYWICAPKSRSRDSGHVLYILRRGVVTSTGSLGGDAELLRVTSVLDCLSDAWVGSHNYSAVSDVGDWLEVDYTPSGASVKYEHGEKVGSYWKFNAGSGGKWMEFQVDFDSNQEATLQFYTTAGSSTDVEISIDGGSSAIYDLSSTSPTISRIKIKYKQGRYTVRITKPTLIGNLYIFGFNYKDLKNYTDNLYNRGFVTWSNGEAFTSGDGANDYAIKEYNSQLFGGSFHGGETLQRQDFVIDGVQGDPLANIVVAENINIYQSTTIDWTGGGGGYLEVSSEIVFSENASYLMRATFKDSFIADTFYFAMHTTPERFSVINYPLSDDISGYADGFITIPRSSYVKQVDSTTNGSVSVDVSLVKDFNNPFGGPSIRKVSGSYNKYYYGPTIGLSAGDEFDGFSCAFKKTFS